MAFFEAVCRPFLVGSLPVMSENDALDLVMVYTPEIPAWVQMPGPQGEGMIQQFAPGLPGIAFQDGSCFLDTRKPSFDDDMLGFYESYMAVADGSVDLNDSLFALTPDTAEGFFAFLGRIEEMENPPVAVKGQIPGPITFSTGIKNSAGRAIFYDEQTRDAAVKLIAMKARWQVRQLAMFGVPAVIFLDEPGLAGFGSSEFISISKEDVAGCLDEVFDAIHEEGGVAGIHVCANTDWSMVMESQADIVNFDAYGYYDRFILYGDHITDFFRSGRMLAWGMVPTLNQEDLEKETVDSLTGQFYEKLEKMMALGIERETILSQSLITPSCGAGTLSLDFTGKVLKLTRDVSKKIRNEVDVW